MTRRSASRVARGVIAMTLVIAGAACQSESTPPAPEVEIGTQEGLRAPELTGIRADSSTFTSTFSGDGPSVLVFYRSAGCGLCRVQLLDLQRNFSAYSAENAGVFGITLDSPQQNQALDSELQLPFDLISVDTATFRGWGALSDSGGTPLPATYVIDREGVIRFRQIGRNAADRATDADIVTVLHRIQEP